MSYGLNLLAQSIPDRARAEAVLAALKPRAIVVMDAPDWAAALATRLAGTTVIHRRFHPDDPKWHEVITPREWLAQHQRDAAGGRVVLQVHNEPHGYADVRPIAAWLAELMARAHEAGVRLCVANWGVGHPDAARVEAGEADALLYALARFPEHRLGVHEYFVDAPNVPHHVGRYRVWTARAAALGLPAPSIVVTEAGRDVGGGHDGWQAAGWSEAAYVARLQAAMREWRKDDLPVCLFGYGAGGGGRWHTFDVQGATWLLDRLAEENRRMVTQPLQVVPRPDAPAVMATAKNVPGTHVNLRTAPNVRGLDRGDLKAGDRVRYYPTAAQNGWVYVELVPSGVAGWVSLQNGAVTFTDDAPPVPVPLPPVDVPPVIVSMPPLPEWLLKDTAERKRMSAWLRWLADVVDTAPGLPLQGK